MQAFYKLVSGKLVSGKLVSGKLVSGKLVSGKLVSEQIKGLNRFLETTVDAIPNRSDSLV